MQEARVWHNEHQVLKRWRLSCLYSKLMDSGEDEELQVNAWLPRSSQRCMEIERMEEREWRLHGERGVIEDRHCTKCSEGAAPDRHRCEAARQKGIASSQIDEFVQMTHARPTISLPTFNIMIHSHHVSMTLISS